MRSSFVVLCVKIHFLLWHVAADGLDEVFKWKQLEFDVHPSNIAPSGESPQESFIPYNNVPMGLTHYEGRIFVTIPRRSPGVLATLNYFSTRNGGTKQSPKLIPYPNLKLNQFRPNTKRLVSVYRTTADACGRLWFVDTGMLQYPNNATQIQRPSIWIMDLKTDRVLRRYEIPTSVLPVGRGLISLTIDVDQGCSNAFAYIPDLFLNQLHVYSFWENRMWSFQNDFFRADPTANNFSVGGQSFSWNDGIFSTTLGPKSADGSRNVFFHPMASSSEFVVSNRVLQDEAEAQSAGDNDFCLLGSRGSNRQSTMHEYDPETGVVYFAEINRNAVGCWNTKLPFASDNFGTVAQSPELIYPSDLTIDDEGTVWVLTNSLPIFVFSTLDPDVFNFRIWKQKTTNAIQNTICS